MFDALQQQNKKLVVLQSRHLAFVSWQRFKISCKAFFGCPSIPWQKMFLDFDSFGSFYQAPPPSPLLFLSIPSKESWHQAPRRPLGIAFVNTTSLLINIGQNATGLRQARS